MKTIAEWVNEEEIFEEDWKKMLRNATMAGVAGLAGLGVLGGSGSSAHAADPAQRSAAGQLNPSGDVQINKNITKRGNWIIVHARASIDNHRGDLRAAKKTAEDRATIAAANYFHSIGFPEGMIPGIDSLGRVPPSEQLSGALVPNQSVVQIKGGQNVVNGYYYAKIAYYVGNVTQR